ncbi:IclR family transcriptional regulator [Halopenitus persicus]|uniref:IclR family transcriptional regulator n=1 Tax=Halopenitus persicus TaxID=1048396 RepID=UPI000BBAF999|nr:IclR family transcriptional regulator [Halopenitus persicus]
MSQQANNPIKSSGTTLEILEVVVESGDAGVTEIADRLDRNKATVHHHLSTLAEHGYLVNEDGRYRPSMRFFEIGQSVVQRRDVYATGIDPLRSLAEETGEVANLMIEEEGLGVYVAIETGADAVRLDTTVGTTQHLHTCALGKAILAHTPEERRERIYRRRGLPAETPNTVTDRDRLEAELGEIRDRGIAFDEEERATHIRCIAAPITTDDGDVLGAVSVSGPISRMTDDRIRDRLADRVENTATIISINTTYR